MSAAHGCGRTITVQHGPAVYESGRFRYRRSERCAICRRAQATHRAGYAVHSRRATEFGQTVPVCLFLTSEVLCRACYVDALDAMAACGMTVAS